MMHRQFLLPVLLAVSWGSRLTQAHAQAVTAQEYDEAVRAVAQAQRDVDSDAFLRAMRIVLQMDDARALRTAVAAYSRFAPIAMKKMSTRDFLSLHGKAAAAFAVVKDPKSIEEFRKLLAKNKEWQGRLLLLDGSAFSKPVNLQESALAALRDESPVVVRRALQYLVEAKKPVVAGAIIERYVALSKSKPAGMDGPSYHRLLLVFQATLHRLLQKDFPTPLDYKNYFEAHREDPNLFEPRSGRDSGATVLTLFGAPVTGKNIVFVLDISGSMTSKDPRPPGEKDPNQGKTIVDDTARPGEKQDPMKDRERMYRAKKELSNVVNSLAEDVEFNIVTFASDVNSWKKSMVLATSANKKSACAYIDGLKAEGITVTDQAMEDAFSDLQVDTIFLITDGAPTHIGTTGSSSRKPEDSDAIIAEIHARVAELNFLRGVRVFALGFEGAEENFLRKLSGDHSGTYTRIR